jgi:hypothetical protein
MTTTARPQPNYALPSQDSTEPQAVGEGLTRTSAPAARLFHMLLTFHDAKPMRCIIRALNWHQAEAFARNRHPTLASIQRLAAGPRP